MVQTRAELMRRLDTLGVEFPPTATPQQLRSLIVSAENIPSNDLPPPDNSTPLQENIPFQDNLPLQINLQLQDNLPLQKNLQLQDNLPPQKNLQLQDNLPPQKNLQLQDDSSLENEKYTNSDDDVIAQLEKKKKILLLRQELQALEDRSLTNQLHKLSMTDIEGLVQPFTGDDAYTIEKWVKDLENVFQTSVTTQHFKFMSMRRLLKGTAAVYLRTTNASTYEELKRGLLKQFERNISITDIYRQLQARSRQKGENIILYMLSMQEIASQGDIEEDEIIGFIIEGLRDRTAYTSMLYTATSLQQLKDLLLKYERKRLMDRQECTQKSTNPMAAQPSGRTRCFNCSQYGHLSAECTQKRRSPGSCFRCGSTSHLLKECKAPAKVHIVNNISNEDAEPDVDVESKTKITPYQNW